MRSADADQNTFSDEDLCRQAALGDRLAEEILAVRYHRLVRICARPYFLAGGDSEDLIQEGMMGLLSAIREFAPEKGSSFRTYAETCIRNRILSAIRADMAGLGVERLYLVTDHVGFYERYGWNFLCMVQPDGEPEMIRMYVKRLIT